MEALVIAGWTLTIGALAGAAAARGRLAAQAEAVARACHEVRGPLTAARLGLEVASRATEPAGSRLRAIELELERASLALDDLGEVRARRPGARRGGGFLAREVAREWIDVAQLLGDLVEAWQGAASRWGVALRLLDPGTRPVVWGDRLRLAQAAGNLIANGIEHGGGAVEVSWRVESGAVRIDVIDRGAGLPGPVAELARRPGIGPSAWRHRRHESRRRPGSRRGHGLAITSAIAAAHGGRLAAAPSQSGARLVLELPQAKPAADSGQLDGPTPA